MARPAKPKRPESLTGLGELAPGLYDQFRLAEVFDCTVKEAEEKLAALDAKPIGRRLVTTREKIIAWLEGSRE